MNREVIHRFFESLTGSDHLFDHFRTESRFPLFLEMPGLINFFVTASPSPRTVLSFG